jgi:stage V sporulation protein AC
MKYNLSIIFIYSHILSVKGGMKQEQKHETRDDFRILNAQLGKIFSEGGIEMTMSNQEYKKMADKASPGTTYGKNMLMAFLVGGAICTAGQALGNLFMQSGMEEKDAHTFVSISLIALSALLTAFQIYDNIAKHAGAGSLVPITGFANSVVSPAMEFKSEGYIIGIGGKMFVIAGPVLVYGITASILYGLVIWIFHLY